MKVRLAQPWKNPFLQVLDWWQAKTTGQVWNGTIEQGLHLLSIWLIPLKPTTSKLIFQQVSCKHQNLHFLIFSPFYSTLFVPHLCAFVFFYSFGLKNKQEGSLSIKLQSFYLELAPSFTARSFNTI